MAAPKRWILENRLGQKVRSFRIDADKISVIKRLDTRRIELVSDLSLLDEKAIPYELIKTTKTTTLAKEPLALAGGSLLRSALEGEVLDTPTYRLEKENDDQVMASSLKKSSIGHGAAVAAMIALSLITGYFAKKEEPALVTIVVPEKEKEKISKPERVQVAERKITQPVPKNARVTNKPVPKPKKVVAQTKPRPVTTEKRKSPFVVRNAPTRSLERVGALAALGGVKNGARGAEGLDTRSMKNIRSAGTGSGGGGVGTGGAGGISGMMPGTGLIAGSAGRGGNAQSAGGYGTRGAGGGRAGYGKHNIVGGTSAISMALDDEAFVQGGLDRDQIQAVINRNKNQITACYERGLQSDPDLRGRVSIQFVIGSSGRITVASVAQSSLDSSSVEGCMVARMRTWQFPRPKGNVNVDVLYPFDLSRVSSR